MRKTINIAVALALCFSLFSFIPKGNAASKPSGAGRVATVSTKLNVRSAPSANASVKTQINKNSYVTLYEKNGKYWYVQYSNGKYGYCHSDYLTRVSTNVKTVKTTSGRLRVRSGASTSHTITAYLENNTYVTVLSTSGKFSRIVYNGNKTGYVHSDYLSNTSTSSSATYKAKKLNVPDFKQTDSRWSNVTLGSSGQTIGKIGCATTALAMTESYRTGTTIYPHKMAQKLSYTSGGAVYWPTNYNIVTSSSGYLTKIYNALQDGKPVIVGAKKSNGSQHYVVVTGVKATNTLTTSSFYINDPGSNTRTTLAQFFSAYPTFYKMLHVK